MRLTLKRIVMEQGSASPATTSTVEVSEDEKVSEWCATRGIPDMSGLGEAQDRNAECLAIKRALRGEAYEWSAMAAHTRKLVEGTLGPRTGSWWYQPVRTGLWCVCRHATTTWLGTTAGRRVR